MIGCTSNNEPENPKTSQEAIRPDVEMQAWVAGQTTSSITMLNALCGVSPSENIVFSPLSLNMALGMLANGAEDSVQEILSKFLNSENVDVLNKNYSRLLSNFPYIDPKVSMEIANSVWYPFSNPLENQFTQTVSDYYQSQVFFLDYKKADMVSEINRWIKKATHNKIPNLLDAASLEDKGKLTILNAFYFSAPWSKAFDSKATAPAQFRCANGRSNTVRMMNDNRSDGLYTDYEGTKALTLPFADGKYVITFILPDEDETIEKCVADLDDKSLNLYIRRGSLVNADVKIPPFEVSYSVDSNQVWDRIELSTLFENHNWEKLGIINDMAVSKILQKSIFKIDENGGEGASGTAIDFAVTAPMDPADVKPLSFILDRPFMYVVSEKSCSMPILMGVIRNL